MNPSVRTVVSRQFEVSAECVFDAWLDPTWIGSWMFGPDGGDERVVRLGVEPRVGGNFSFVIDRLDVETKYHGKYLELERPHLLVFTWNTRDVRSPASNRLIIEIAGHDQGCELTLTLVMSANDTALIEPVAAIWRRKLETLARAFVATKTLTLHSS